MTEVVGTRVILSGGILGGVVGMGRTEVLGTGVTDAPGGPCGRRCGGGVVEALSDIGVGSIGGAVVVGSLGIGVVEALETGETISGGILGGVVGAVVTEVLGAEVALFGGLLGVEYGALEGVSGGVGGIGTLEVSLEGGVGSIAGVVGFDGDGLVGLGNLARVGVGVGGVGESEVGKVGPTVCGGCCVGARFGWSTVFGR